MKLMIHRKGQPPIEVDDAERFYVDCGNDRFEIRESARAQGGLLVRLEEHDGYLSLVRLKGGVR